MCQGGDALTQSFRGRPCHRSCRNAIRSFQRLVKDNPQGKAQADKDLIANVDRWRSRVRPLVVAEGEARTAGHRQLVKDKIETETQYTTKETIQDFVGMSLTRYVSWRCWADRLTPTVAEQSFYEELEKADDEVFDSDGEPIVKVKMSKVYRQITGASEIATTSTAAPSGRKRPREEEEEEDEGAIDDCDEAPGPNPTHSTPPPKVKAKRDGKAAPASSQRSGHSPTT